MFVRSVDLSRNMVQHNATVLHDVASKCCDCLSRPLRREVKCSCEVNSPEMSCFILPGIFRPPASFTSHQLYCQYAVEGNIEIDIFLNEMMSFMFLLQH